VGARSRLYDIHGGDPGGGREGLRPGP
jgi:hypothetical protein